MNKQVSITLLMKLGSIAIHAEELISPEGHTVDKAALETVLNDPEVREFLSDPKTKVLLPLKR
jgi:hypothetical protein